MGMIPDDQWLRLRNLPDWQDRIREAIDAFPEGRWLLLTVNITAGALNHWHNEGILEQPGWWQEIRVRAIRSGAWDPAKDLVSRSWLKEQMFHWMIENLDIEDAARRSASELRRLIDLQSSSAHVQNGDEDNGDHDVPIQLTPSELEDLLDLEEARRRVADAAKDDWVSWDEIEAELRS